MALFTAFFDFLLHLDVHLGEIIAQYHTFTYLILFLILFAETGLVFTPFLPGDSLLFAAGAFAALNLFNLFFLFLVLWLAAFLGDTVNYWLGRFFGQQLLDHPKIPLNQKHINQTQVFYQKHGGKTIFLARFIPIIRTFAPFVAGLGKMNYRRFVYFNALGGLTWVLGLTSLGYFFGNIPLVRHHFSLVVVTIILISLAPFFFHLFKKQE
jgi:membrane-associated protein